MVVISIFLELLIFQNDNKMKLIQNLIIHDAIGKQKSVLDQLREGLKTLGFLERMAVHPDVFKVLFIAGKQVDPQKVTDTFQYPEQMTQEEKVVAGYLKEFIKTSSPESLEALLTFTTRSPCLPDFGLGKVMVEFADESLEAVIDLINRAQAEYSYS